MGKGFSRLCAALLCGGSMAALGSVSASATSLEEALVAAYANNPTLSSRQASVRAADEAVPQALAGWRPDVRASTSYGRLFTYSDARADRSQTTGPFSVSLTVTQPVFDGYQTIAATSAADASVEAARARLVQTEQSVLFDAAVAYMTVLRDLAVLDLNINNEQVLKRQLEATRDRFEVGELTRTDVSQAEARHVGASANRIRSEGVLELSRAVYRNVVGAMPDNVSDPGIVRDLPTNQTTAMDLALANHPSVQAAEFDQLVAHHQVKEARGRLQPTVGVSGALSRDYDNWGASDRTDSASLIAVLTVPLYQKGTMYSRLRQARHFESQLRMTSEQARRDTIEGVTRAWEALMTAQASGRAFDSQIKASEIALDGVEREAQVGSRTVLDVLDAEQELLDAKVNHVLAKSEEMIAAYQLKAAVGQMTARNMGLKVDIYDPTRNYDRVREKMFGGDIEDTK